MQTLLFEQGVQRIADDITGPITYYPDVITPPLATAWFDTLREQGDWHESSRMMYERLVGVPRLHCQYSVADPALPKILRDALAVVKQYVDAPFNSIGLNGYRDEHDSVAPHNARQ